MDKMYERYLKYLDKFTANESKYGMMAMSRLDFEEYISQYEATKDYLKENGKNTSATRVNNIIVDMQTFKYSKAQAKARQTLLYNAFGDKRSLRELRLGRTDKQFWDEYKQLRETEKAKWLKLFGNLSGFEEYMREEYWGSE